MSATLIALFLTVGVCTWIYSKLQRVTGNDTRRSLIAATAAGILVFTIAVYVFNLISSK